jgi:nitrile hydratase accessory protein
MAAFNLESLPGIPVDDDGPVFLAPWEAQAFAMVVNLHEQGLFPWSEWTQRLAEAIARAQQRGDPDLGNTYYEHWLDALERLVQECGLATSAILAERKAEIRRAHEHADDHDH